MQRLPLSVPRQEFAPRRASEAVRESSHTPVFPFWLVTVLALAPLGCGSSSSPNPSETGTTTAGRASGRSSTGSAGVTSSSMSAGASTTASGANGSGGSPGTTTTGGTTGAGSMGSGTGGTTGGCLAYAEGLCSSGPSGGCCPGTACNISDEQCLIARGESCAGGKECVYGYVCNNAACVTASSCIGYGASCTDGDGCCSGLACDSVYAGVLPELRVPMQRRIGWRMRQSIRVHGHGAAGLSGNLRHLRGLRAALWRKQHLLRRLRLRWSQPAMPTWRGRPLRRRVPVRQRPYLHERIVLLNHGLGFSRGGTPRRVDSSRGGEPDAARRGRTGSG